MPEKYVFPLLMLAIWPVHMGISSAALDSGIKKMATPNIKGATKGGINGTAKMEEKKRIKQAIEEVKIGPGRSRSWMPWG